MTHEGLPTARRTMLLVGGGVGLANTAGGAVVAVFLTWVLPGRPHHGDHGHQILLNLWAFAGLVVAAFFVGWWATERLFRPISAWLVAGRDPTPDECAATLRHPMRQAALHTGIWLAALPVFVLLNYHFSPRLTGDIAAGIVLASESAFALSYLLVERIERPLAARALAVSAPSTPGPGVSQRVFIAWALGSGVPLFGLALYASSRGPGDPPLSATPLVFLVGLGLISGALVIKLAATAIADPLAAVTAALAEVERGRLDVSVPVYDASEIGRLQRGFNAMVEGLRERQRLEDIFGRQVGPDVAQQALARGVELGGEEVDVAVLFVDVIGSTALTADGRPHEVVAALNAFFGVVVEVVGAAGGFVNKFEGDAAMCVFGAPVPREDAATCALSAARALAERLAGAGGLTAAVGVSAGPVIAGNIGAAERFEYTVIGDPVNEAARLTELAKTMPSRVLASATLLGRADPVEVGHWVVGDEVLLRGRPEPTRLAEPVALRVA